MSTNHALLTEQRFVNFGDYNFSKFQTENRKRDFTNFSMFIAGSVWYWVYQNSHRLRRLKDAGIMKKNIVGCFAGVILSNVFRKWAIGM